MTSLSNSKPHPYIIELEIDCLFFWESNKEKRIHKDYWYLYVDEIHTPYGSIHLYNHKIRNGIITFDTSDYLTFIGLNDYIVDRKIFISGLYVYYDNPHKSIGLTFFTGCGTPAISAHNCIKDLKNNSLELLEYIFSLIDTISEKH